MIDADIALLVARLLLAVMFAVSALDKFRLDPVEMGQISSLHLPAPAALERLTGVFEMVGASALIFGVYARIAAVALALFVVFVSLIFVQFWSFKVLLMHESWCITFSSAASQRLGGCSMSP